jgi:hypothetical protein
LGAGILNEQTALFFVEYDVAPTYYDRIVELGLNDDGTIKTPYYRRRIYKIQTVADCRSDNGRIEYYALYCSEKDSVLIDDNYLKK